MRQIHFHDASSKYLKVYENAGWIYAARNDGHNVLYRPDAVYVIAKNDEDKYLVIRQFRRSINSWIWEFPAGLVELGSTAKENAVREVKEETGLDLTVNKIYFHHYPTVGLTNEQLVCVTGTVDGVISKNYLEHDEMIEAKLLSIDELTILLKSDVLLDAKLANFIIGLNHG